MIEPIRKILRQIVNFYTEPDLAKPVINDMHRCIFCKSSTQTKEEQWESHYYNIYTKVDEKSEIFPFVSIAICKDCQKHTFSELNRKIIMLLDEDLKKILKNL